MKRIMISILLVALLAGCTASTPSSSTAAESTSTPSASPAASSTPAVISSSNENDVLIAWFSRVGNSDFDEEDTADTVTGASVNVENGDVRGNNSYLEEIVERKTGADEYFIEVQDLYPGDFGETVRQFVEEEKEDYFHPLATSVDNMDHYSTIILIYPTWDSTLPSPVRTFLKSYDFTGKKIYPVNSNDGFGLGDSISRIETYAPGAEVMDSFSIYDEEFDNLESRLTQYLQEEGLSK